ncbi:MAG: hypothetical protein ACKV0T_07260 [Planctomycetales bacterium]
MSPRQFPTEGGTQRTPRATATDRFGRWRRAALAGALLCLLAGGEAALALDVEQTHWGYDGQVVPNRFNLLSLLVSNPSAQPFDGRIELRKLNSAAALQVDAPLVEEVYLAPYSSRWVQFFPFSKLDYEDWILTWGPSGKGEVTLTRPRHGKPGVVLLDEADALSTGGGSIKRLPEQLFPAQLTGTDALAGVVLDHVPRWEEGRQVAFVEWVRAGGRVHLLQTPRGEFPAFSGPLAALNVKVDKQRIGSGYIYRHERDRKRLDTAYMERVILPERDPSDLAAPTTMPADNPGQAPRSGLSVDDTGVFSYQWEGDLPILRALKKMSRANHRWILIHLLSLTYILLVFPGCYLLGKHRRGDYNVVFGALLGGVALFSLIFLLVGRRGYGEQTSLHSAAIARVLHDGRFDVTQWSNAFVVEGGDYQFTHQGTARIYSTCQDDERVRGEIRNGAEARLSVDMPPFSSRWFGHRMVAFGPPISATITQMETVLTTRQDVTLQNMSATQLPPRSERILQKLVLVRGEGFPTTYSQIMAIYGRRLYSLVETGDGFELKSEIGSMGLFLRLDKQNRFDAYFDPWSERDGSPDELFAWLYTPLVARSAGIGDQRDALDFALPEDRVRLLIYAPMPKELFLQNERFDSQRGYVLYSLDVFPPEFR